MKTIGISKLRLVCTLLLLSFVSVSLHSASAEANLSSSKLPLILDRPDGLPRSLFPFRSYGSEAGLGNLAVRRIVQDKVGFLWVGTEDGLYRFDGYRFRRFDSGTGLPSTWITDLLSTPDGDLWICTPQGVAVRDGGHTDNRFSAMDSESSGLPPGSCNAIARDSRGVIWVAHKDGLFFRRNRTFQRFVNFPAGSPSTLVSGGGLSNEVWAAVKGVVVRISDYRAEGHYPVNPGFAEPVDSLAVDGSGRVWALSARKLFCLLPGSAEFRNESAGLPTASWRGILSTDRSGRLWVPTDEGMSCMVGEKWQHFGAKDGLPTEWTRYIFEDREGSLWIGSLGVHSLVGRGSWTSWTQAQGLPSDTVWHIYRSSRGDLWVATDKGVCIATSAGWRVLPGTEKQVVRRIHEDARGRIWMGLVPAAIFRYDPETKEIARYGSSSGIAGTRVLCLEEDERGQLWAATDGGGLLRYRPDTDDFVREKVPGGTPEESFRYILRDRQDRLWITGEHGLLLRSGGEWRRFVQKDGLLQNHISYIAQMASGEFWLSYFEPLGIVRFTLEEGKLKILTHLSQVNGLSSEKVYLLGEDFNGDLWVGTGNGLDIVSSTGMRHLSKADGLAGNDIDAMAILVESSGAVFIGTSSGLSMYRSDAKAEGVQPPQPVFLSASVGDQPLFSGRGRIPSFP
ncbi:MAG: Diguanylate cyclase, partial [Acidobacteria bacterium]|nr:Diguanylate cyclase [Acidobacteriota bacterium]